MLARIRTTARAEADRVLLVRRGRVPRSPGNTEIAGRDVRGVSLPISSRYDVAAVRPVSTIDRASRDAWLLVVGAALVTLATIGLIAAAAAPLLARGRFAYRERTQALRVLSHVEDGVVLTEAGVVQLWNRAAERITGLRRDDVLGKPLTAVPGLESIEGRIPVGREGAIRPETLPVEVGGDELWLSIVGVEVAGGVVYTFGDVTDEQRLEELKTDFISTVSHEMRTPLAGIYGAAVTLRERGVVLPPQLRDEFLETIRKQSERLAELVEDVLLVDRLDARGVALGEEPFDAVALAGDVVAEARLRGASVELVAPRSVDVVADSGRTRQVLTNLLDNAVKYGGDGRIVVTVGAADAFVRFGVRDEGPGIPRDEHERIFEKFHRFDPQMEYGVGGSGLGLYICRELVVRMNGRIWVESAPGEGATFAFELPRAEGAAVQ